jgi:uncharacterized protein YggE
MPVSPDSVVLGVEARSIGSTSESALQANNNATQQLFSLLRSLGVPQRNITNTTFSLTPNTRNITDASGFLIPSTFYTALKHFYINLANVTLATRVIDRLQKCERYLCR